MAQPPWRAATLVDDNGDPIGVPTAPVYTAQGGGALDAFGRTRTASPYTVFDSKQLFDNAPLFWDESLESGAGITSSHDVNEAATTITSTVSTAGLFTRRTFQCFNYQPGKSQLVMMTGVLRLSGGGTGQKARIGQFGDDNGLFFVDDAGTLKVVQRSKASGSVVDTEVEQSAWNLDKMDGTGTSGITIDPTKANIFIIDYEWLGVGRVRLGCAFSSGIQYVHEFDNANAKTGVYMSSPNLQLTYQLETTASSPATSMSAICSTVISEGGVHELGINRCKSTEGTHVDANVIGTVYALVGMRLKTTHLGSVVMQKAMTILSKTAAPSNNYEWLMLLNPTVAGTFTYSDETNSSIQTAVGATANTVTGGTCIDGGFAAAQTSVANAIENARYLGVAIDGTRDEIILCVRPLNNNIDIEGSITWREIS